MQRTKDQVGRRRAGPLRATLLLALGGVAACEQQTRSFGYAPTPDALAAISVGVDTRESVVDTLGSPGSLGVLGDDRVIYVAQEMERFGFREPRILRRDVVALSFDEAGVVRDIERLGLEDGNVVAYTRAVTDAPTEGVGFLRQLGTNLGRILPTSNEEF